MFTQEIVDFTNRWMFDLYNNDQIGSHAVSKIDAPMVLGFAKEHKTEIIEYLKARKNIDKLFPGLREIKNSLEEWKDYQDKISDSLENGGIGYPDQPKLTPQYYIDKYPQAYGYFLAHQYFGSGNPIKSRIGNKAMTKLMNGESVETVISKMKKEWSDNCTISRD